MERPPSVVSKENVDRWEIACANRSLPTCRASEPATARPGTTYRVGATGRRLLFGIARLEKRAVVASDCYD